MKSNKSFQRGFTLIELMIVIVILGILMGTILPRLTGAQGRARDTARIADLNNLSQALEVYYNDNGGYPETDAKGCLNSEIPGATSKKLGNYMKGGRVPKPVSNQQNTLGCIGMYYYRPLIKDGVANASYVLASDVETFQMANYLAAAVASTEFSSTTVTQYSYATANARKKFSAEATSAQKSIYIVIP